MLLQHSGHCFSNDTFRNVGINFVQFKTVNFKIHIQPNGHPKGLMNGDVSESQLSLHNLDDLKAQNPGFSKLFPFGSWQ